MKNKILAMLLSFTLIFTTTGFSFAEDEVVDEQKSEPVKTEKVVEKKAEPVVEKKEVKEVVVKEEAKPEVKQEATKEDVKVESEKAEVKLDKEPPKEIGPPLEGHHPEGPTPEQPGGPSNPPEQGHFDGFTVANWEGYYDGHSHSVILNPNPLPNGYYYQYRPKINNHAHWKLSYKDVGTYRVGVRVVDKHGAPVRGGDEKTAYVIIKPVPTEKLKLVFTYQNANGNKAEITPAPEIGNGETYTAVSAPTGPIGKVFSHWAKTSGNGPATINAGDVINGKTTETQEIWAYHAVYEDDVPELFPLHYSFTYADANGNKTMFAEGYIDEGETYEVGAPTNIPKGKVFSHWAKNKVSSESASEVLNAGDVIEGKSTEKEGEQWIYYAVYKNPVKEVTVTFIGNQKTFTYDGENHRVSGYKFDISDPEYKEEYIKYDAFADKVDRTDVGTTETEFVPEDFVNTNDNFKVTFVIGQQMAVTIEPREITIAAVYKFKTLKDVTDDEEFDATVTGVLPQDEEWFEDNVYWDVDCDYEEAVGDYPIIVEVELWDDEDEWIIIDWEDYAWEDYPQEMKKVEDVPMMAAKSVGFKKNTALEAGNYTIKTVDNVFQIRDKEEPVDPDDPDDPDNPVVGPTDNGDNTPGLGDGGSTVMKAKSSAVQTGDADACWALLNLLLMITSCLLAFIVVLSRVFKRDEEYVDESKSFFNNWFESIISGVVAVFTAIIFFITENMNTLMVWTDRWTVMMVVLFVLQLAVVAYVKFRNKIFEEDN